MALPKLSTGALNIYADPHLGSEISPTTSPAASSKQEDSDPNYTLNYEEPVICLFPFRAPHFVNMEYQYMKRHGMLDENGDPLPQFDLSEEEDS